MLFYNDEVLFLCTRFFELYLIMQLFGFAL